MTARGQLRNVYPGMRVFAFGEEVTDDTTSCTVNFQDGRAPNTAEIVLANKGQTTTFRGTDRFAGIEDRYIITATDIHALYDDVILDEEAEQARARLPELQTRLATITEQSTFAQGPSLTEQNFSVEAGAEVAQAREEYQQESQQFAQHIDRLLRRRIQRTIRDDRKRRILSAKVVERVRVAQPSLDSTITEGAVSANTTAQLTGDALRYSFQQGDCIFHSNDPVRIFWRDPHQPSVWFHMFAGFVTDWNDAVDADNQRIVTLKVEDPTRVLRYARVATNPGIFDIRAIQQTEDLVIRTFFNAGFAELTLTELMYTIVFGPELASTAARLRPNVSEADSPFVPFRRVSVNGSLNTTIPLEGAGAFNFERSLIMSFGPKAVGEDEPTSLSLDKPEIDIPDLSVYQAIVDHRVRPSDLETMLDPAGQETADLLGLADSLQPDPLTGEIRPEAIITTIGRNPHLYPVDGGRLLILVPGSLGVSTNRRILTRDLISSLATQTTFRNRLGMIYDAIEQIEFSFYATPKGDIVLEPPLYDFNPEDFGEDPIVVDDSTLTPEDLGIVVPVEFAGGTGPVPVEAIGGTTFTGGQVFRQAFGTDAIGTSFGPFAPHYRIPKSETIAWNRTFSDERVRTQMVSEWNLVQAYTGTGTSSTVGLAPRVVTLRGLVPQFGVRIEQAPPTVFLSNPESANVYLNVKLNQWNADARSHMYDLIPRLRPMPNRPLLFAERNEIATLRSVSHTLVWNQSMTMRVGVNYVRGWDGSVADDGETPVYNTLGGKAARGLDYRVLFRQSPEPTEASKSGQTVPNESSGLDGGDSSGGAV